MYSFLRRYRTYYGCSAIPPFVPWWYDLPDYYIGFEVDSYGIAAIIDVDVGITFPVKRRVWAYQVFGVFQSLQ